MESLPLVQEEVVVESGPFVGRWYHLISTTNWEKGKIIFEWRHSLAESGLPPSAYSDEMWSRTVGGISPQHVGRLRRVYERFAGQYMSYQGLYWSHFHAALDWDDAEMWLEGAVQNDWSVAQMRRARWDTLGGMEPLAIDEITSEIDEDLELVDHPRRQAEREQHQPPRERATAAPILEEPQAPGNSLTDANPAPTDSPAAEPEWMTPTTEVVRPFAKLPKLPDDLAEAFESFKLAILRHKLAGWSEITREDLISVLEALRVLALADA